MITRTTIAVVGIVHDGSVDDHKIETPVIVGVAETGEDG